MSFINKQIQSVWHISVLELSLSFSIDINRLSRTLLFVFACCTKPIHVAFQNEQAKHLKDIDENEAEKNAVFYVFAKCNKSFSIDNIIDLEYLE